MFTPNPFYLMTASPGAVRVYNIHTGKAVKTLRAEGVDVLQSTTTGMGIGTAMGSGEVDMALPAVCGFLGALSGGDGVSAANGNGHGNGNGTVDGNNGNGRGDGVDSDETWVVAGMGKSITIWELSTRRIAQKLVGHTAGVVALAIHPDGRWIATGSVEPERVIRVWRDVPL